MPLRDSLSALQFHIHPILGSLHTTTVPIHGEPPPEKPILPFITISRQAGAGGRTLADNLVEYLGQRDRGDPPWTAWDKQLVEKVAADHHISRRLIESLEQTSRSWLEELFGGLQGDMEELAVFRRTAQSIRALAQVGRAVIVGRGGVHLTRQMPGGIHLRLIAPLESRIARVMEEQQLTREKAARWIHDTDHARHVFHKRYFPRYSFDALEIYSLTINTGRVDDEQMVRCVSDLVPAIEAARQTV